ncbi:HAD superfamily hydrolase (TIGR01549 family) [Filimonas zeae]|uniref:Flavin mononucleotide phosphatase n=1 Tax=Filimonas zeae TaxID=1737353 RepID=A0A917MSU9_9BACT|nr:HAD family hydrolase [Filimonas zeae]MDR6338049.1 HAD superfamily hydrolase (TIGR01549 family) [Filimonas zeae]GGH61470.1 flavin mononucleotide phosphatase [Filimonas zeae]
MKTIQPTILLFDLDNTLFNRNSAMRKAMEYWLMHHAQPAGTLEQIMEKDGFGYADRTGFCQWLLDTFGKGTLPYDTPATLLSFLQQQLVANVYPNAEITAMLTRLQPHYRLALASNGSSHIQRAKLKQCGLDSFFASDTIFISGEMPAEKPSQEFFTTVLARLQVAPGNILMTGDDYQKDVAAPQACGMQACWVSHNRQIPAGVTPDITITHITELEQWLKH